MSDQITLDRSAEPWRGSFPGLGRIEVSIDGSYNVLADAEPADSLAERETALRFGWAEPLSLARRGFVMSDALSMCSPCGVGVLLVGEQHEVQRLLPLMMERGWSLIAERPAPVVWQGDTCLLEPRSAPVLVSKRVASKYDLSGHPVREGSDAVAIETPRAERQHPLGAVVWVKRRKVNEDRFDVLSGQDRFAHASRMRARGVFVPTTPDLDSESEQAQATLAEDLRWARLPAALARPSSNMSDATELLDEFESWIGQLPAPDLHQRPQIIPESAATGEWSSFPDVSSEGSTVWLASYPKSGNTWVRAIFTALTTKLGVFSVNSLASGAQPFHIGSSLPALGLDVRYLTPDEVDRLRVDLIRHMDSLAGRQDGNVFLRKTHEMHWHSPSGVEMLPSSATRAAILVVRDPRDVAISFGHFFGCDLPESITRMNSFSGSRSASPIGMQTGQPWGSWSEHTLSWLDEGVPFPVHVVRYEDLQADAAGTLGPVLRAIGVEFDDAELVAAVDSVRFDRLHEAEQKRGFRETSPAAAKFFRAGKAGGWVRELTDDQVASIESAHGPVMRMLGYETQEAEPWLTLPDELGIEVSRGPMPPELAGATRPRPWIEATPDEAIVRFGGGSAVWVRGGHQVRVWHPHDESGDPSWILHGWGVTLSFLQRGVLSLHAATVQVGDKVIAVAGNRGAGKSTTAMALREAGHRLLVDDVSLIEFTPEEVLVRPYLRNVHLLPDAADAVGVVFAELPLLAGGRDKAAFQPEQPPHSVRLDGIVVLARNQDSHEVSTRQVRGTDKVKRLLAHTTRDGLAKIVMGSDTHFAAITELAARVPVWQVVRPREGWTLQEVVAAVEELATET